MNEELIIAGGGSVTVALGESSYAKSRGTWIVSVPVALHQDGEWLEGGTVYTTFDFEGLASEAVRWAHERVRSAHNTGEPT
jgi:hypothetical protein